MTNDLKANMKLPKNKDPLGFLLLTLGALSIASGFNLIFGIAGALISLGIVGVIYGFVCFTASTS